MKKKITINILDRAFLISSEDMMKFYVESLSRIISRMNEFTTTAKSQQTMKDMNKLIWHNIPSQEDL